MNNSEKEIGFRAKVKCKKKYCAIMLLMSSCLLLGQIGHWDNDEFGLPYFIYTGELPYQTPNDIDAQWHQIEDPYFILGNHRFTMFQHTSGNFQIYSGERAWGVLNRGEQDTYAHTLSHLSVDSKKYKLTGNNSLAFQSATDKRFGCGFARFAYQIDELSCSKILSVRPSKNVKTGTPAVLIRLTIKNEGDEPKQITYKEEVLASYQMIGRNDVDYLCQSEKNNNAKYVKSSFQLASPDPYLVVNTTEPSYYDTNPPSLYMMDHPLTSKSVKSSVDYSEIDRGEHLQIIKYETILKPGKTINLVYVIGYEFNLENTFFNSLFSDVSMPQANSESGAFFQDEWRGRIPKFKNASKTYLTNEMQWNAYVLEAMATYLSFYDEVFIPQGMSYDYLFGNAAAFRDHAQSGLPLCYYDPNLAKSILRMCMKKIRYSGEIPYTDIGYGNSTNHVWITSDQQLYFFFFLSEYLRITKDYKILDEETEWNPVVLGKKATSMEKIRQAFFFLRDEIGFGTSGLVRLMNSDWNDMVFHTNPVNMYFQSASSHLNSAMVVVVLKNLVEQIKAGIEQNNSLKNQDWEPLVKSMELYLGKVKQALDKDLGSKAYSSRGYLSKDYIFGDTNLYLEPQPWLLQRDDFPVEKKIKLYRLIKTKLMEGEVLGARQMEMPIKDDHEVSSLLEGTAENGGFWFSLNSPLILGVNTFNKKEAHRLLEKMSFYNFSKNYPGNWVGHWSNADCVNSTLSQAPGHSRPDLWTSFPIFCSHPHAWPIYCHYRLNEVK